MLQATEILADTKNRVAPQDEFLRLLLKSKM
jgi:hypothetical protein